MEVGPKTLEIQIATRGLNARLSVARYIASVFPVFALVVELVQSTMSHSSIDLVATGLTDEFEAMCSFADETDISASADYQALMAGMVGFMERHEAPERNEARLYLRLLECNPSTPVAPGADEMADMGRWFTDYQGYRRRILDAHR